MSGLFVRYSHAGAKVALDAFARTYARTPSELRRRRRRGLRATPSLEDDRFLLRLPFRPPFDWHAALGFLAGRATPGVECVGANTYCRTISLGGRAGRFEVRPVDGENFLTLHIDFPDSAALFRIVERVRLIFDLGADPQEISKQLARDRRFAGAMRAHPGLRVPGAWDPFELAVRAILGQQISVKGATTLAGRIAGSFGEKLIGEVSDGSREPAPDMIFPTPAVLAEADLSRIGLTRARAHAIRELARAVETGDLVMDAAIELAELEEMLTRLPGIGSWTAQYITRRCA